MTPCPSDEKLAGLLADGLSMAEREALARHVEGCAPCQEQLARLTGIPDRETWRRAEHPPRGSGAEEAMMRRLKQMPPWLAATDRMPAGVPAGHSSHPSILGPEASGRERPAVP